MSDTYSLVCRETETKVWIGQGKDMKTFYSKDGGTMSALHRFLVFNMGKELLTVNEHLDMVAIDYREFE